MNIHARGRLARFVRVSGENVSVDPRGRGEERGGGCVRGRGRLVGHGSIPVVVMRTFMDVRIVAERALKKSKKIGHPTIEEGIQRTEVRRRGAGDRGLD